MHIHWYKRAGVEETDLGGHLGLLLMKLCRCGSIKTRSVIL